MTTRVFVVNHGPDKIVVKKVNPNNSDIMAGGDVIVYPHNQQEFYVYDTQALSITEIKE